MMPHALIKNNILKLIVKCYQTLQSKKKAVLYSFLREKNAMLFLLKQYRYHATEGNTKRQIIKKTLHMTEMLEFIQSLLKIHITPA